MKISQLCLDHHTHPPYVRNVKFLGTKIHRRLKYRNGDKLQNSMDYLSILNHEELKIMVLDNGAFHKAQKLNKPENIVLVYLQPYSPQLNPTKKMWRKYKRLFSNLLFDSLEKSEDFMCQLVVNTTTSEINSICRYSYIFSDNLGT